MRTAFTRCHGLAALAMFTIAGCSGLQSQPATLAAPDSVGNPSFKASKAWVFVSDPGTSEVYIYTLPTLKLIEIVTGFTQPQGECSDNKGNVWVTDGTAQTIFEVEHSGSIGRRLSDTSGYPGGCAWNPKTGNLAVMNLLGTGSLPGAVLIYHHAAGVPNVYSNPKQFYYNFGWYDSAGNLFFDGRNASGKFMLSELPVNAVQAKSIAISGGKIYYPGLVQWSSSYLAIGDQNCGNQTVSCIYRLTVSKTGAAIKGKIALENSTGGQLCDLIQGVIWQGHVVGSDSDFCGSVPSATYVWPYPGGGKPTAHNAHNDSTPFGAAISVVTGGGAP